MIFSRMCPLIRGTSLGQNIKKYTFFSYEANEALHLSEKERQIILDCLVKINHELRKSIDRHSKTLIANNIELLLNYCMRFYDRQFITRGIAYDLGFKHPQHFSRMFKNETGYTPNEYRLLN